MGLTKRRDSYYVEFRVLNDGKALRLAHQGEGGRLKRWKVGSLNKTMAKQQESIIKTDLMKGSIKTDHARPVLFKGWELATWSWRRFGAYGPFGTGIGSYGSTSSRFRRFPIG